MRPKQMLEGALIRYSSQSCQKETQEFGLSYIDNKRVKRTLIEGSISRCSNPVNRKRKWRSYPIWAS
jgi:hypothetical protein